MNQLEYLADVARAYLRAPAHSPEERLLDQALKTISKRLGVEADVLLDKLIETEGAFAEPDSVPVPHGSYRDPVSASRGLEAAAAAGHLIGVASTTVGTLPEGVAVVVHELRFATRETYAHEDEGRGIAKAGLLRIAGAAGVDWHPTMTRRLDAALDPHFCRYQAVGRSKKYDGSEHTITGECMLDLRPDSERAVKLLASVEGAVELRRRRVTIQSICETQAKCRAVLTLPGMRSAWTEEELQLPFFVVQVIFDGQSSNPETQKYFRERVTDRFLGSRNDLYGPGMAPLDYVGLGASGAARAQVDDLPFDDEGER